METFIARPSTGPFRHLLHHRISDNFMAPVMLVWGLNPAGSDERACRASSFCRRVAALAQRLGVGNVVYVNVVPRITPDASALHSMITSIIRRERENADALERVREEVVGAEADAAILEAVHHSDFAVVGFGTPTHPFIEQRAHEVFDLLSTKDVYAVGPLNKGGWPRHPSARSGGWPSDALLTPWAPPRQPGSGCP